MRIDWLIRIYKLNISRMFIHRTLDRFSQASTVDDRNRNGCSSVVRMNSAIKMNALAEIRIENFF